MKKVLILLLWSLIPLLLVSCDKPEHDPAFDKNYVYTKVSISIDKTESAVLAPRFSTSSTGSVSTLTNGIKRSLIVAVPAGSKFPQANYKSLLPKAFDKQFLDLATRKVVLKLPMETGLQLFQYTFYEEFDLTTDVSTLPDTVVSSTNEFPVFSITSTTPPLKFTGKLGLVSLPKTLTITPEVTSLQVNETQRYSVTGNYADDESVPIDLTPFATFQVANDGILTPGKPGEWNAVIASEMGDTTVSVTVSVFSKDVSVDSMDMTQTFTQSVTAPSGTDSTYFQDMVENGSNSLKIRDEEGEIYYFYTKRFYDPFSETRYLLDRSTREFSLSTEQEEQSLELRDGLWQPEQDPQNATVDLQALTITYQSPDVVLSMVDVVSLKDTEEVFEDDGVTIKIPFTSDSSFKYLLSYKMNYTEDRYVLDQPEVDYSSNSSYKSLDSFIEAKSQYQFFTFRQDGTKGLLFGSNGVLLEDDINEYFMPAGNAKNVGTWQKITTQGVEVLTITPTVEGYSYGDVWGPFWSMYQSQVYRGHWRKAGIETGSLVDFNNAALTEVKSFFKTADDSIFGTATESPHNLLGSLYSSDALITPNGKENWQDGQQETISWSNSSLFGETLSLYLIEDTSGELLDVSDQYALAEIINQKEWELLPGLESKDINSGVVEIDPASLGKNSDGFRVLLVTDTGHWDISDENFSINQTVEPEPEPEPELQLDPNLYRQGTLTAPGSGEIWTFGQWGTVSWLPANLAGPVTIHVLFDDPSGLEETDAAKLAATAMSKNWEIFSGASNIPKEEGGYEILTSDFWATGNFFRILLVDSEGNWDISDYSFTVDPGLVSSKYHPAALQTPNGGELWKPGTTEQIIWDQAKLTGSTISIYQLYGDHSSLDVNSSNLTANVNGSIWGIVGHAKDITNEGAYSLDPKDIEDGSEKRILLIDSNGNWDISDAGFTRPELSLEVNSYRGAALTEPSSGTNWKNGTDEVIRWDQSGISGSTVTIYLLRDSSDGLETSDSTLLTAAVVSKHWEEVSSLSGIGNSGEVFLNPETLTDDYHGGSWLLIVDDLGNWDLSDGGFSINDFSSVNVTAEKQQTSLWTSPAGKEQWEFGSSITISWDQNLLTGSSLTVYYTNSYGHFSDKSGEDLVTAINDSYWHVFEGSEVMDVSQGSFTFNPEEMEGTGQVHLLLVDNDGNWQLTPEITISPGLQSANYGSSLLTWPNGGELLKPEEEITIQWNTSLLTGSTLTLYTLHDGSYGLDATDPSELTSNVNGKNWGVIHEGRDISASMGGITISSDYFHASPGLRILLIDDQGNWDISDADFSKTSVIVAEAGYIGDGVLGPNGGEQWPHGESATISWDTSKFTGSEVTIHFLNDTDAGGLSDVNTTELTTNVNGKLWSVLSNFWHLSNNGGVTVDPSNIWSSNPTQVRVLIQDSDGNWDISDYDFSITYDSGGGTEPEPEPTPSVEVSASGYAEGSVIAPNGGEEITYGDSAYITWDLGWGTGNYIPVGSTVSIYILEDSTTGLDTTLPEELAAQVSAKKWRLITSSDGVSNSGYLEMTIDSSLASPGSEYRLLIINDLGNWDISNGNFSIISGP